MNQSFLYFVHRGKNNVPHTYQGQKFWECGLRRTNLLTSASSRVTSDWFIILHFCHIILLHYLTNQGHILVFYVKSLFQCRTPKELRLSANRTRSSANWGPFFGSPRDCRAFFGSFSSNHIRTSRLTELDLRPTEDHRRLPSLFQLFFQFVVRCLFCTCLIACFVSDLHCLIVHP